jgi:hypothetical protein
VRIASVPAGSQLFVSMEDGLVGRYDPDDCKVRMACPLLSFNLADRWDIRCQPVSGMFFKSDHVVWDISTIKLSPDVALAAVACGDGSARLFPSSHYFNRSQGGHGVLS